MFGYDRFEYNIQQDTQGMDIDFTGSWTVMKGDSNIFNVNFFVTNRLNTD